MKAEHVTELRTVTGVCSDTGMETLLDGAAALLEKANVNLEPDLMSVDNARALLAGYARIKKLADYGEAVLSKRLDDPAALARVTGTSLGKAKATVATGAALKDADEVKEAFKSGSISGDQAGEIARAEKARRGSKRAVSSMTRRSRTANFPSSTSRRRLRC
jgi:hypothetical protein